jgi:hypothetical protein
MPIEISGGTDRIGRGDRAVAVGTDSAEAEPGARFPRPRRTDTADGPPTPRRPPSLADARRRYDRTREVLAR